MKKLHIFATAAALLVAVSAPSLAASRTDRAADAYASADRSGAYYYGPQATQGRTTVDSPFSAVDSQNNQYSRGRGLPYADRPYGDPDGW